MITNVGIKENQKEMINLIVSSRKNKYNSINEVVQKAVEDLISKEKETKKEDRGTEGTVFKIESFVNRLLEDELDDKIAITMSIAQGIKDVLERIKIFKINFKYENKSSVLISAIQLKDALNELKKDFLQNDKDFPKDKISKEHYSSLEKLKTDFIKSVKNIKR